MARAVSGVSSGAFTAYRALRPSRTSRTCAATSSETRTCASAVEAPRCGVSSVFGASSSGEPVGGSCSKTSIPAPPRCPDRSASATAASSTTPPRATLRRIDPGLSRAIASRPMRPRVARVNGTWTVTTSARANISSNPTISTPWLAAASAVTYGSTPSTTISIARARTAMACPILPSPTIPSVRPRSSSPVNCARFHSPRRTDASAAAIRRATPYSSARVCSAAAMVLPVGALTTTIPARVAASRSTVSTPTPARPMTASRDPAAIIAASTWTWLRTIRAS